jgi:hypothetical protein
VFIILDGILLLYFIFGSAQLLRFRYGEGATVTTILTYLLPTLLMALPLLVLLIVSRYFVKESIMRREQPSITVEAVEVVESDNDTQESDNSSDEEVLKETISSFENSNDEELEKEDDTAEENE